ncbi:MAG: monovalent cation/H+ antiporter subunit D family protein [Nitrospira sp.]|nr:monovalent cation/H+ antiporter subunit D family protein [Nitrospira sp.]
MTTQSPALLIIVPLISAILCLLLGLIRRGLCYPFVVAVLGVSVILSFDVMGTVLNDGVIRYRLGGWDPPWGIEYMIDHLNAFIAIIIASISFVVAIFSRKSIEHELAKGKIIYFYTIYLLLFTGLMGIVVTGDVFNIYVFLEIASLAGYALIAIGRDRAVLASFEYVVLGTVGACFYLLGVGYLYSVTGSLNIMDLTLRLPELYHSKVILIAFAFFMVGLALKIALFPLHVWLPDAYTYAPSTVSAMVAATMTKVGAYVMMRIMFTLFEPYFSIKLLPVTTILGWVAAAAMIFGCIQALAQTDFKRVLCYILIAEVGYIVLGISVGNRAGFTGAVLHILNDAVMMACLFMIAGAIYYKTGMRHIYEFAHLHKKMPVTVTCLVIAAISVVGVPPTCGFFSKWYLVLGAIDARQWFFAFLLLASSLMVAIVFFKMMQTIFFAPAGESAHAHIDEPHKEHKHSRDEAPASMMIPIFIMVAGILLLGIFSGQIVSTVIQFTVPKGF